MDMGCRSRVGVVGKDGCGVSGQGDTQPHRGVGDRLPPPQPISEPSLCLSSPVQVGEMNGNVVVKCNTSEQQVNWTQNGETELMAEVVRNGQTLTIIGLDLPSAGNYSCWAGAQLLDTTYVVVSDTSMWGWRGWGQPGLKEQGVGDRVGGYRDTGTGWGPGGAGESARVQRGCARQGYGALGGAQREGNLAQALGAAPCPAQPPSPRLHQARRRRMSPARLSPTAAPSTAPGPGPTILSSAPASHAGGCPWDPPSCPWSCSHPALTSASPPTAMAP